MATTIQVTGVQHPAGRQHEHVLVFGYRAADPSRKIVLIPVSVADAVSLIEDAQMIREFPEIEIADYAWAHCLSTGNIRVVHFNEKEPGA